MEPISTVDLHTFLGVVVAENRHTAQVMLPLFEKEEVHKKDTTSTFSDNMSLPIHRSFRYSAGFSANWVHQLIEQEKLNGRTKVLDPFSGSGTVLLESGLCDVESIGIEAHPFV